MKKLLVILFVWFLLVGSILPPQLPSSFWGWVNGGAHAGQIITVWTNGAKVAQTTIFLYQGNPVYAVDVIVDNIPAGAIAAFKIGNQVVGTAALYSGTDQHLDLFLRTKKIIIRLRQ